MVRGELEGLSYFSKVITASEEMKWSTAYVEIPKQLLSKDEEYFLENIEVHGGVTFFGYKNPLDTSKVIGWDYNHVQDISILGITLPKSDEVLMRDITSVVHQLNALVKDDSQTV